MFSINRITLNYPRSSSTRCLHFAATSRTLVHFQHQNQRIKNHTAGTLASFLKCSTNIQFARPLSTKDIFCRNNVPVDWADQVPSLPLPAPPRLSLAERLANGQSILDDLELWSAWKPSAWLRWLYELTQANLDLPWWATIVLCTAMMRLTFLYFPIRIQQLVAVQRKYAPEIAQFRARVQEARNEDNQMLVQQIMIEQRDFLKKKNVSLTKHLPFMCGNITVFVSQFWAIREMANAKYPGFSDGGMLWFNDLTLTDPYWALPLITAVTLHFVMRTGLETGSTDVMMPALRYGMLYGMPFFIFVFAGQFPAVLCMYWVTNNVLTIVISRTLKVRYIRDLLNIPPDPVHTEDKMAELKKQWKNFKSGVNVSPTRLRQDDMEQFRKAGRGKPVYMPEKLKELNDGAK